MSSATILLVDDDVEVLRALTKVLEKEHYTVVALPDANSAVQHVNTTKQRFDLVITDISMPGMKGTSLLAAFKTAFPRIPVILITAFADWGQYMDALRDGAFEYLYKPIEKSDALTAMDGFYQAAYALVSSPQAREAFNLAAEPQNIREEYGMNEAGQRMLMARRLVESGVRLVSLTYGGWDMHGGIANAMQRQLPNFDKAYATLIRDLDRRGMLDKTVVMVSSEFEIGRAHV